MPLVDVEFQAGITTILEAMAMGRAVVCTRTAGQTDTIVDGVTGLYVPPGDADALRATIQRLLDFPAECAALGRAARDWVVEHAELDRYAEGLADVTCGRSVPTRPRRDRRMRVRDVNRTSGDFTIRGAADAACRRVTDAQGNPRIRLISPPKQGVISVLALHTEQLHWR
jgi:hypothetical protein